MLDKLKNKINKLFERKPLKEIVADELEHAMREKRQAALVIHEHHFIKHMAQARIDALIAWDKKDRGHGLRGETE